MPNPHPPTITDPRTDPPFFTAPGSVDVQRLPRWPSPDATVDRPRSPGRSSSLSCGMLKLRFLDLWMSLGHGGFHSHGGIPRAGWFRRENPTQMDDDWGTPISGNHHMEDDMSDDVRRDSRIPGVFLEVEQEFSLFLQHVLSKNMSGYIVSQRSQGTYGSCYERSWPVKDA